jgi:hypothetical protein
MLLVASAVLLSACSDSSRPAGPRDALTLRVAHKCSVDVDDVVSYGDESGFAGPNYTWTLSDGSELSIYNRMSFDGYRLSCPNHRTYPLPSFNPSSLPRG